MGNMGPTVRWDDRIVGGWVQRGDGTLAWQPLADPGGAARAAIEAEAERLTGFLGGRRFTPARRTLLEGDFAS
ncbi:DNA glycosylase AlkZ-like family protein [Streptomyces sp. NRRL B-2790]|uniref:DNA glycosylase AlkZ-like family protein n=1 Tax=Streptomyces sp. NRRL B-2790 TaxID=1463835 RepID=UPI0035618182